MFVLLNRNIFVINFSDAPGEESLIDDDNKQRGRQGRQQSGDTYTLEIAFPAVKYVCIPCF